MRVLNLYAGIGGNRKLWQNVEVTAIENNKEIAKIYKKLFPNDEVIIADAHSYLLKHLNDGWDFIWSSPPCQTHSRLNFSGVLKAKYSDMKLYQEIILLRNNWYKGNWIIENVIPFYRPLIIPKVEIGRHYFWSNSSIDKAYFNNEISLEKTSSNSDRYGFNLREYKLKNKQQILRNLVNPQIGLYLFNQVNKINNYEQFTLL